MAKFSRYCRPPKASVGPGGLLHSSVGPLTKYRRSLPGKTLTYLSIYKEPEGAWDRLR